MLNWLGVCWALLSAASFGCHSAATWRSVRSTSATLAMYASAGIGLPVFLLTALLSGEVYQAGRVPLVGYAWLAASGIVHFILGRYCNYRAIGAIGANRSHPVSSTNLLFTVALSVLVLHEQPQWHTLAGTVLIMLGPLLSLQGQHRTPTSARGTVPLVSRARLAEGYIFGLLAAACYGSSPALVRLGLGTTGLPIWGATVSVGASLLVLLLTLLRPGQWAVVMGDVSWHDTLWRRQGAWYNTPFTWLVVGSLTIASAQLFRYLALSQLDVTLAAPLIASNGLFTLLFGWLLNRQTEPFSRPVVLGVVLSVVGSVVLLAPLGV